MIRIPSDPTGDVKKYPSIKEERDISRSVTDSMDGNAPYRGREESSVSQHSRDRTHGSPPHNSRYRYRKPSIPLHPSGRHGRYSRAKSHQANQNFLRYLRSAGMSFIPSAIQILWIQGGILLFTEIRTDRPATLCMLDPEIADTFVLRGKGHSVCLWMGKECRMKSRESS